MYLATVYDVIQAVVDMNKSDIFGYPLKVLEVTVAKIFVNVIRFSCQ